jgi:hypothetical protein
MDINILPPQQRIKYLTYAQKREIDYMQKNTTVRTYDTTRLRVLKGLVRMGIADYVEFSVVYRLRPEWLEVDLTPKAERTSLGSKNPLPDPPRIRFVRPPAVYNNISREQRIEQILNPPND